MSIATTQGKPASIRSGPFPARKTKPLRVKRAFDVISAGGALFVLAPVFLALILAVRKDGGKPFYAQMRVGHGGRHFRCWKFRTMAVDAEHKLQEILDSDPEKRAEFEQYWKLKEDPRVTRIGRYLRRHSLDELPQLLNVILGDMSVVGPRPRSVSEMEALAGENQTLARHYNSVRPGLTGPWQVSGRNRIGLDRKAVLDARYARKWSLMGDFMIILKTFKVIMKGDGAH